MSRVKAALGVCLWACASVATAAPCAGFTDVSDTDTLYCAAVTYLKNKAVTLGCLDGTKYCPNDVVTRLQMALFLHRMGRGGPHNILAEGAAIGGGDYHETAFASTVAGGMGNIASGSYAAIGGGTGNVANADLSFVGGGEANSASGPYAVNVGGQEGNASGSYSAILGGLQGIASGSGSVVLGGDNNVASADFAVAMGNHANADQTRCVLIALWSGGTPVTCRGFASAVRIAGDHGLWIDFGYPDIDGNGSRYIHIGNQVAGRVIASSTGAYLSDVGMWNNNSNRDAKHRFQPVDIADVLARVTAMPITQWEYKLAAGVPHIGPMAQDFHATFGLGGDDKTIGTIDEAGVALAAIQGLNAKLEAQNAAQARELAEVKAMLADIRTQLAAR